MEERISVDRLEGEIAVAERADGTFCDIALSEFADPARETCCYIKGADARWHLDTDETDRRKKENAELLRKLLNR